MKRFTVALLISSVLALGACAPKQYITVVAPKKTEIEQKQATAMADHIYPVTHAQSLANLQKDLAKPEIQQQLRDMIANKVDDTSLGECLTDYGFGDYFSERMLAEYTPEKIRAETIRLWVEQIPMDMFKKADQTLTTPQFSKTWRRLADMGQSDTRTKLKTMVADGEITDAQANEFFLTIEDRDIKSFLIITQHSGKIAIDNLVKKYRDNPSAVILEFMKTHSDASAKCSFVEGGPK